MLTIDAQSGWVKVFSGCLEMQVICQLTVMLLMLTRTSGDPGGEAGLCLLYISVRLASACSTSLYGRPLLALHLFSAALFRQLAPGQELGQGLGEDRRGDGKTCCSALKLANTVTALGHAGDFILMSGIPDIVTSSYFIPHMIY